MADNPQKLSRLALLLAGLVLVCLALFLHTGGRLGGTQPVNSDADLPEVASPTPPSGPEMVGMR